MNVRKYVQTYDQTLSNIHNVISNFPNVRVYLEHSAANFDIVQLVECTCRGCFNFDHSPLRCMLIKILLFFFFKRGFKTTNSCTSKKGEMTFSL